MQFRISPKGQSLILCWVKCFCVSRLGCTGTKTLDLKWNRSLACRWACTHCENLPTQALQICVRVKWEGKWKLSELELEKGFHSGVHTFFYLSILSPRPLRGFNYQQNPAILENIKADRFQWGIYTPCLRMDFLFLVSHTTFLWLLLSQYLYRIKK